MHARAFAEWADYLYGEKIEVRVEQLLENSSWVLRQGVRLYNAIQRHAPWAHHAYYQIVEALSLIHQNGIAFGQPYFTRLLETFSPDVILSVHDCLNRGYFALARKILGSSLRCVTFCLEFEGGYGFSRNWADPTVDLFLGRTPDTAEFGERFGIPRGQCKALGDLFPRRFCAEPLALKERENYLAERFGFTAQRLTLLLATGGAGAENHLALLENLSSLEVQVIALCGRDSRALERLNAWRARHPHFHLHALPFTDAMPELLQVSSAVIARAGGIAAEALFFGCPVIFNTIGGTMPQEIPTIRYFRKRQIATVISRATAITPIVQGWLAQPDSYQALRARVAACKPREDPHQLVAAIIGDGARISEVIRRPVERSG